MAHDVFISHSAKNRPVANAIRSALELAGFGCRCAPRIVRPGRLFSDEVASEINQSKALVLILSGESNDSEQILHEVQLAAGAQLLIIEFRIENVTPNDYLQPYLSRRYSIEAIKPSRERQIAQLKKLLGKIREKKKDAEGANQASEKPEDGQKISSRAVVPAMESPAEPPVAPSPPAGEKEDEQEIPPPAVVPAAESPAQLPSPVAPSPPVEEKPEDEQEISPPAIVPAAAESPAELASPVAPSPPVEEKPEEEQETSPPAVVPAVESPAEPALPVAPSPPAVDKSEDEQKISLPAVVPAAETLAELPSPVAPLPPAVDGQKASRRRRITVIAVAALGALGLVIWGYPALQRERSSRARDVSPAPPVTLASPSSGPSTPAKISKFSGNNPGISFLNMTLIFKNYAKTKQAENELNGLREAVKKEYDSRVDAYKKSLEEVARLESDLTGGGLSVGDLERLGRERDGKVAASKKLAQEINDFRKARQKQIEEQAQKLRDNLLGEIMATIRQLTGPEDSVVFDNSGMSSNGVPVILFSPSSADMSERLLTKLNQGSDSRFAPAHALPFATVDLDQVFASYSKTKQAEEKLNEARDTAKKEYDERTETYKKALEELNQLNQALGASGLSAANKAQKTQEREAKISQMKAMEREMQEFRTAREKQLTEQAARVRTDIVNEITKVVAARLPAGEAPVIIDKSGMTADGLPLVVYTGKLPDWSGLIIARLNQSGPSPAVEEAPPSFSSSEQTRFGYVDLGRVIKVVSDAAAPPASEKDAKALAARKAATLTKALEWVRSYAERNGSGVIFNSTGNTLNLLPVLVMAEELPDLTDAVIAEIH
ncbi:MAG: hypothetical protein QOH88_1567 [Verrucomicrobiota bacterium]|jgi:Skp family chaperone for outer membrane proteins